jgi:hypothetical protein
MDIITISKMPSSRGDPKFVRRYGTTLPCFCLDNITL